MHIRIHVHTYTYTCVHAYIVITFIIITILITASFDVAVYAFVCDCVWEGCVCCNKRLKEFLHFRDVSWPHLTSKRFLTQLHLQPPSPLSSVLYSSITFPRNKGCSGYSDLCVKKCIRKSNVEKKMDFQLSLRCSSDEEVAKLEKNKMFLQKGKLVSFVFKKDIKEREKEEILHQKWKQCRDHQTFSLPSTRRLVWNKTLSEKKNGKLQYFSSLWRYFRKWREGRKNSRARKILKGSPLTKRLNKDILKLSVCMYYWLLP